jgi:Ca2+-binding EF-hand superfamily protein
MAASEQESDGMDIKTFRQVMFKTLNLSRYFMIDRVFSIFDTDSDGKVIPQLILTYLCHTFFLYKFFQAKLYTHIQKQISPAEYISGLSTMLRGSLNDQIDFAFKIYDQAGKGFLTQEDVSICLNESSRPTVDEQAGNNNKFPRTNASAEVNDDLCQLIFPKLDADGDGQVTYDEFRAVCLKDPTLVESLGPCLPKNCSCPLAAQKDGNKNGSSSLDYLMKVSSMTKICKPFKTAVNRDLTPIDMQNK